MAEEMEIPGTVVDDVTVPAGGNWGGIVRQGRVLRIIDLEGRQGVDFLCYNAENPEERYHAPNTLKKARTLALGKGHVLYSDVARPMFTILDETCGVHDTIGGCCSGPSNRLLYGVPDTTGCRENFLAALSRFGLGRRDIVPNLNFFANVPVGPGNRLTDTVFEDAPSRPGDYIDLRAEMDAIAVISNCPQVNNPAAGGRPTPIRVVTWEP